MLDEIIIAKRPQRAKIMTKNQKIKQGVVEISAPFNSKHFNRLLNLCNVCLLFTEGSTNLRFYFKQNINLHWQSHESTRYDPDEQVFSIKY